MSVLSVRNKMEVVYVHGRSVRCCIGSPWNPCWMSALSVRNKMEVVSDVSMGGRLDVALDVSKESMLDVSAVSVRNKMEVVSDVSMGGRLDVVAPQQEIKISIWQ